MFTVLYLALCGILIATSTPSLAMEAQALTADTKTQVTQLSADELQECDAEMIAFLIDMEYLEPMNWFYIDCIVSFRTSIRERAHLHDTNNGTIDTIDYKAYAFMGEHKKQWIALLALLKHYKINRLKEKNTLEAKALAADICNWVITHESIISKDWNGTDQHLVQLFETALETECYMLTSSDGRAKCPVAKAITDSYPTLKALAPKGHTNFVLSSSYSQSSLLFFKLLLHAYFVYHKKEIKELAGFSRQDIEKFPGGDLPQRMQAAVNTIFYYFIKNHITEEVDLSEILDLAHVYDLPIFIQEIMHLIAEDPTHLQKLAQNISTLFLPTLAQVCDSRGKILDLLNEKCKILNQITEDIDRSLDIFIAQLLDLLPIDVPAPLHPALEEALRRKIIARFTFPIFCKQGPIWEEWDQRQIMASTVVSPTGVNLVLDPFSNKTKIMKLRKQANGKFTKSTQKVIKLQNMPFALLAELLYYQDKNNLDIHIVHLEAPALETFPNEDEAPQANPISIKEPMTNLAAFERKDEEKNTPMLVVRRKSGTIDVFNASTSEKIATLGQAMTIQNLECIALQATADYIIASFGKNIPSGPSIEIIQIWNSTNFEHIRTMSVPHDFPAHIVTPLSDGRIAFGSISDVRVYKVKTGELIARLHAPGKMGKVVTHIAELNSKHLAIAYKASGVSIWNSETQKQVKEIPGSGGDEGDIDSLLCSHNCIIDIIYLNGDIHSWFIPESASVEELILRLKTLHRWRTHHINASHAYLKSIGILK